MMLKKYNENKICLNQSLLYPFLRIIIPLRIDNMRAKGYYFTPFIFFNCSLSKPLSTHKLLFVQSHSIQPTNIHTQYTILYQGKNEQIHLS